MFQVPFTLFHIVWYILIFLILEFANTRTHVHSHYCQANVWCNAKSIAVYIVCKCTENSKSLRHHVCSKPKTINCKQFQTQLNILSELLFWNIEMFWQISIVRAFHCVSSFICIVLLVKTRNKRQSWLWLGVWKWCRWTWIFFVVLYSNAYTWLCMVYVYVFIQAKSEHLNVNRMIWSETIGMGT